MTVNKKKSSKQLASQTAKIIQSKNASQIPKTLAASVISQSSSSKQTGVEMETIASNVLKNTKYSDKTKTFVASVLSQANKERTSKK
ncbi:hypothetical protein KUA00_00515 [Proteus mirabilis]|uniref:hypothetical protein n=1 Tax=Morganellaceae TaxID=1903414 RepID=UPI0018C70CD2|nr:MULTISPECIES: hypothetical protein [Morganellaceae]MBG5894980.1 hypothetical protein [Providencia stuartii]MCT0123504.1 hypothetical protein [Proteus mirabilis]